MRFAIFAVLHLIFMAGVGIATGLAFTRGYYDLATGVLVLGLGWTWVLEDA